MKKIVSLVLVLIFVFISFGNSTSKAIFCEENNTLTVDEKKEIDDILKERNVPLEKRQNLIEKLEKGQLWDSMKDEYRDLKPQVVTDNYSITTYPDGSYMIKGIVEDITDLESVRQSPLREEHKLKSEISGSLYRLGVTDDKTREKLIDKYENGELWDSFKKEYKDLKPQQQVDGFSRTVYPDGSVSISITKSDINEDYSKLMPNQSSNIKLASAYKDNGVVAMYYEVRYEQDRLNNLGKIHSVSNYNTRIIGGTDVEETPGHEYGWKNPTHAWYATKVTVKFEFINRRYWLKFYVNGTQTWTDDNFYF